MFDTIPRFTEIDFSKPIAKKAVKSKRSISKKTAEIYAKRESVKLDREAQSALASELSAGIDSSKSAKVLVMELRELGLGYKLISRLVGCTYGYVRNLCSDMGMTNAEIKKP